MATATLFQSIFDMLVVLFLMQYLKVEEKILLHYQN